MSCKQKIYLILKEENNFNLKCNFINEIYIQKK